MKASKLIKRLRREAKASPKKAAALGLLLLVAIYYWMPLLKGMVTKADVADAQPAASADAEPAATVAARPRSPSADDGRQTAQSPKYEWQQLADWIDNDALAHPSESLLARRSPFQPVETEISKTEPEQEVAVEETVQKSPTPESLGMALSATVVGPGRRVAVIDGKAYPEGQSVPATQSGEEIKFKLSEVHPERIVLERQGERFELAIPRRASSARIEVVGN